MGSSHLSFTKICKSCGQQKPLSAFQQLTEGLRTTYGNVCASCRKINKEQENTTSTTGKKIDAKAKVQGEADKRELRKQVDEDYFKERDKKGERLIKRTEKTVSTEHAEKKIRSFLENRTPYKKPYTAETKPVVSLEDRTIEPGGLEREITQYDRLPQNKTMLSESYRKFKTWLKGSPSKGTPPLVKASDKAAKQQPSEKAELAPLNEFTKKRF